MATISSRGERVETSGELPTVGSGAPAFALRKADLSPVSLGDYAGSRLVLNIFPSIDTPTCAKSVRQFNERAAAMPNTHVLCVSADLPFALSRFCGAEGIERVETASVYRAPEFGIDYGVYMAEGRLGGLLARAVVAIDESGKVMYTELVPEIAQEPDYDAVLAAL
ncbi:MAG: thiol peroxidase [Chromatiaceae bacterium]|nr:thiol peroxidase [Gammaproteobacteria bacterium]MCP5300543.1 thiol peroxidase [Chromatiaceae bacterium]MCP5422615.1 thiol peroxidase [Chromatiaceae bacterium]